MIIKKINFDEAADLSFELSDNQETETNNNYCDNEELQKEFLRYKEKCDKWNAEGKEGRPQLSNAIGLAIINIAKHRIYSKSFLRYTDDWKEEMVDDAIENCVRYVHNYDPIKYSSPFNYITTLVSNAIIYRIKKEKYQLYLKYKSFDMIGGFQAITDENCDTNDIVSFNSNSDMYDGYLKFIDDYEKYLEKQKEKKAKKAKEKLDSNDIKLI